MSTGISIIKEISFFSGGFKLKGYLHLPGAKRPPVVIGSHGLYSSSSSPKQIALADQCNRFGIAYFRFDHRGCGSSEGKFEKVTSLEARGRDLADAAAVITTRPDTGDRLGLFGSSMGGAVCLAMAGRIKPRAIVTVAAPIKSASIIPTRQNTEDTGNFPPSFYRKKLQFNITGNVSVVDNLLLFHGDADETVPVSHGREIFSLAAEPKKMIIQRNGDHRMSNPAHQREFIQETADWYQNRMAL